MRLFPPLSPAMGRSVKRIPSVSLFLACKVPAEDEAAAPDATSACCSINLVRGFIKMVRGENQRNMQVWQRKAGLPMAAPKRAGYP
ncbi:hypothetical protein [Aeromonas jandaei]|uniref:hypothetical protein n=1 Tax=Aeromonas jandaei TaxID=650 RepID=UPI003986B4B0